MTHRSFFFFLSVAALAACKGGPGDASSSDPNAGDGETTPGENDGSGSTSVATDCDGLQSAAKKKLDDAAQANLACTQDSDCTTYTNATTCFDSCSGSVNSAGAQKVKDAIASAESVECATYKSASCPAVVAPPCDAPQTPHCANNRCQ